MGDIKNLKGKELEDFVADAWCGRLENKRELPPFENLRGQTKHEFENEFNTLFQTIGELQFERVSRRILKKLCWAFAVWGARNLQNDREK